MYALNEVQKLRQGNCASASNSSSNVDPVEELREEQVKACVDNFNNSSVEKIYRLE
jgi:hypothetical protein